MTDKKYKINEDIYKDKFNMSFELHTVLEEKINEAHLRAYCVGYDLGILRLPALADILMDGLVDFAFGYHTGILNQYDRRILIEAAKSLYKINEYKNAKKIYLDNDSVISSDDEDKSPEQIEYETAIQQKGEFGELILHLYLRDYFMTVPLLSKIFFKDTDGFTVHGFDAIHIGNNPAKPNKPSLFLGESKIYYRADGKSGEHGVKDLAKDINDHFHTDFLKREFVLVSKKKNSYKPIKDYPDINTFEQYEQYLKEKNMWIDQLHKVSEGKAKLQDLLDTVTIPVICTYQSKLFEKYANDEENGFREDYEKEIRKLETKFKSEIDKIAQEPGQPIRTNLNIILIMLPIPSKKELVLTLHKKVWNQHNA